MEFERSIFGTINFCILAIIHLSSVYQIIMTIIYYDFEDGFTDLLAEICQLLSFFLYVFMIFVAIEKRLFRFMAAFLFFVSFVMNITALSLGYYRMDTIDLLFLGLVVFDLFAIVALCCPPYWAINKVLPFYAKAPDHIHN